MVVSGTVGDFLRHCGNDILELAAAKSDAGAAAAGDRRGGAHWRIASDNGIEDICR